MPANIPAALTQPCQPVTNVPKDPNIKQITDGWAEDRQRLGVCRNRHMALTDSVEAIEGQFIQSE